MFFGKKKTSKGKERSRPRSERSNLNEFGLPGIGPNNDDDDDLEAELFRLTGQKSSQADEFLLTGDDDEDVEVELARLMGDSGIRQTKKNPAAPSKPNLAATATSSINTGDEDVEDEEIDENDPDLLDELAMITTDDTAAETNANAADTPSTLTEADDGPPKPKEINQMDLIRARLETYKSAEADATKSNESSRARRFNRGVKTLEKLLKRVASGEFVPFDEIPPEIATKLKPASEYPEPNTEGNDVAGSSSSKIIDPSEYDENDEPAANENPSENAAPVSTPTEINQADLIRARLEAYKSAAAIAKTNNDALRERRFNRGVKTLQQLLPKVVRGEFVPFDEIPPEIATNLKPSSAYADTNTEGDLDESQPPATTFLNKSLGIADQPAVDQSASPNPSISEIIPRQLPTNVEPSTLPSANSQDFILLNLLESRREEYKTAALNAKKRGDLASALTLVKCVKTCDRLISDLKSGKTVNQIEVPKPLGATNPSKERVLAQGSSYPKNYNLHGDIFEIPATVMGALEQRLAYYEKAFRKAEASNNRIETRRHGDDVRVYQNAIKLHKKGSRVPFEKLPTPPGCPPIPLSF